MRHQVISIPVGMTCKFCVGSTLVLILVLTLVLTLVFTHRHGFILIARRIEFNAFTLRK